ncbi:MAG TPA: hypothetical protein PLK63_15155 [Catalimonadaceae bacterium]|nr:hypothetical protein [Catalimonadaceae bacterium]
MKSTLIAGIVLLLSFAGRAQDQVKIKMEKEVMDGKILFVDWSLVKLMLPDGRKKKIAMSSVDSIYSSDSTVKAEIRRWKTILPKLKETPLQGPHHQPGNIVVAILDTSKATGKETVRSLVLTQISQDRTQTKLIRAGDALNTAGTCILLGVLSTSIGTIVSAKGNSDAGIAFLAVGGVLSLVGIGNLITSGNILRGTKAQDLRIGLGGTSAGLRYRF